MTEVTFDPAREEERGSMIRSVEIDRNGLQILDRDECLRLLAQSTLGRLGLSSRALPIVLPVNFLLDGDRILIRTGWGSQLDAAARNEVVAFEADAFDPSTNMGWSVVVTGVAREITDSSELDALSTAPMAQWAPEGNGQVIAISTERSTGRRTPPGRDPTG